jgi:hypothetical protein
MEMRELLAVQGLANSGDAKAIKKQMDEWAKEL